MADAPPQPCEPAPAPLRRAGRSPIPDEVWDRVRTDYLDGLTAEVCARRHGLGVSTIRRRAAADGWRRTDQPWGPRGLALDPGDEGVRLEAAMQGDLTRLELADAVYVAERRMLRALLRGHAQEALRWRRLHQLFARDLNHVRLGLRRDGF